MPINELDIGSGVTALVDGEYFDDEVMDNIVMQLDPDVQYADLTRDELDDIAIEAANIFLAQFVEALVDLQRTLREAGDIADLIDRFEAEDQDWEI